MRKGKNMHLRTDSLGRKEIVDGDDELGDDELGDDELGDDELGDDELGAVKIGPLKFGRKKRGPVEIYYGLSKRAPGQYEALIESRFFAASPKKAMAKALKHVRSIGYKIAKIGTRDFRRF
jgi:hypothetical protein